MIEFLRLQDLGIIKSAHVELQPGLTVLTGETGAGKTMVLSALDLLLGGKSASGLATSEETRVQGGFVLKPDHPALRRVEEAGGDAAGGELLITRTLPAGGRSRCVAGGVAVPQSLLAELGEQLVAVHGQSEQSQLRKESVQRAVVDRFGGQPVRDVLAAYSMVYSEVRSLDEAVSEAVGGAQARLQELEQLRLALERIEAVAPEPDEEVSLAARAQVLGSVEEINAAIGTALSTVNGDGDGQESLLSLAATAKRAVDAVSAFDPELAQIAVRLAEVGVLSNELAIDLSSYLASMDASPGELETVEARRAEILSLTRMYGPTVADVISWSQKAAHRVFELDRANDIEALRAQRTQARGKLAVLAEELSSLRRSAAEELMSKVSAELRGLSMPDARLLVQVRTREHSGPGEGLQVPGESQPVAFGVSGVDEVRLLLAANRGSEPADLAKAASGGELSRVMLALEVVLAAHATAPTFVFDEVDAGVGGKAAVEIGKRLAKLGQTAQVLVVTHLPQVAAFADHHLVVSKQSDGQVTTSDVRTLDSQQRVRELARMLAGQDDSAHAAAHANELLDLASRERTMTATGSAAPH